MREDINIVLEEKHLRTGWEIKETDRQQKVDKKIKTGNYSLKNKRHRQTDRQTDNKSTRQEWIKKIGIKQNNRENIEKAQRTEKRIWQAERV